MVEPYSYSYLLNLLYLAEDIRISVYMTSLRGGFNLACEVACLNIIFILSVGPSPISVSF